MRGIRRNCGWDGLVWEARAFYKLSCRYVQINNMKMVRRRLRVESICMSLFLTVCMQVVWWIDQESPVSLPTRLPCHTPQLPLLL
jgi:hypothetical protein